MAELILGEALECIIDHRGKTPKKLGGDFVDLGVPVASAMLVRQGKLHIEEARCIPEEMYRKWMPVPTERNDVLLTSEAPLGRVALVANDNPLVLGQRLFGLRGKKGILDGGFLFYALQSSFAQKELRSRASGTTVLGIRQSELLKIRIPGPNFREQQSIARILGTLDEKIVSNDRVTTYCDELRRTRLAEANYASTKNIPLSSTARFINGRAFTKDATGHGRMVIRIAELNSGPGASTVWNDLRVQDVHLARAGDILFAWSGSLTVSRWFRSESVINQHIFKVIPNEGFPNWLIFESINTKLEDFRSIAADKATTMGHIQRHHLDELVTVPDSVAIENLDRQLGPLWDRALAAEIENLTLTELRDTLLQQFMSGELRVKDAEILVEDAV